MNLSLRFFIIYLSIRYIYLVTTTRSSNVYTAEFSSWLASSNIPLTSPEEYTYRLNVFSENKELIDRHNSSNISYKLAINKFAAITNQEFNDQYLMKPILNKALTKNHLLGDPNLKARLPKYVNWYENGMVNEPEDQGSCGSCYSFATNAAMESFYAINVEKDSLRKFSKQYMVDCGTNKGLELYGCDGGVLHDAFKFLSKYGVVLENEYTYKAAEQVCKYKPNIFYKLQKFENVNPTIEKLAEAISKGPVVVGVEMTPSLRFYKSGIVDTKAPCGFFLNHAILAIGYDFSDPSPHFIFKNSYGEDWGDNGFFRIAMGVPGTIGMCGVAHEDNFRPIK